MYNPSLGQYGFDGEHFVLYGKPSMYRRLVKQSMQTTNAKTFVEKVKAAFAVPTFSPAVA